MVHLCWEEQVIRAVKCHPSYPWEEWGGAEPHPPVYLCLPSVICWWSLRNTRWGSVWRAVFQQKYFNFWMQLQPLDFLVSHLLWISAAVHCLPGDSSDSHLLPQGCLTLPLAQSHPETFPCLSLCFSLQDSRQEGPGNPHPWLTGPSLDQAFLCPTGRRF